MPGECESKRANPRGEAAAVRHPVALAALGLAAGAALGSVVGMATSIWVGVPVAALACSVIVVRGGAAKGALLGAVLGLASVVIDAYTVRWAQGGSEGPALTGLALWPVPVLALLGAAAGRAGDFVREALPRAGRSAVRVIGGLAVVYLAVCVADMFASKPVRDLADQVWSGEFRGIPLSEGAEPLLEWEGVALDIPIMFYPVGYFSSFQLGGPLQLPEEECFQYVQRTPADPEEVAAWYLRQCARYGLAHESMTEERRVLRVADPAGVTGMIMVEISPAMISAEVGSETARGSRIVISVHLPQQRDRPAGGS